MEFKLSFTDPSHALESLDWPVSSSEDRIILLLLVHMQGFSLALVWNRIGNLTGLIVMQWKTLLGLSLWEDTSIILQTSKNHHFRQWLILHSEFPDDTSSTLFTLGMTEKARFCICKAEDKQVRIHHSNHTENLEVLAKVLEGQLYHWINSAAGNKA